MRVKKNNMEEKDFKSTIKIVGEIDLNMLQNFLNDTDMIMKAKEQYDEDTSLIKELYIHPFPRITLEISTPGGSVDVLNTMLARIDRMKEMDIIIDTHVEGMAYSAGFILAIVGEKKTASTWSTWMNHGSHAWVSDKIEAMKNTVEFYDKCDERLNNLIMKQTDMPKEHIEMAKLKDMYYDFDDAVEYGLITHYEGYEETQEEINERIGRAFDFSVDTFMRLSKLDEEDSIIAMFEILGGILGFDFTEDEEDEEKNECNGNCEHCDCHHEDNDEDENEEE